MIELKERRSYRDMYMEIVNSDVLNPNGNSAGGFADDFMRKKGLGMPCGGAEYCESGKPKECKGTCCGGHMENDLKCRDCDSPCKSVQMVVEELGNRL